MSKFTINNGFYSGKYPIYPGGYIDIYQDTFFIMSSRGILGFGKSLEDNNFKQIKNNLNDFISLKQFNKNRILTKNVPDAIKWHFATYWTHISQYTKLSNEELKDKLKKSSDIIDRCIALPIFIKTSEIEVKEQALKAKEIISEIVN